MVIVSVLIACLYKAPEDISVKNTAMHLFLKGLSNKIFLSFAPVILEILISRLELIPLILISFAKKYIVANLISFVPFRIYPVKQWNLIPYPSGWTKDNCYVVPINTGTDTGPYNAIKIDATSTKFVGSDITLVNPDVGVAFLFLKKY